MECQVFSVSLLIFIEFIGMTLVNRVMQVLVYNSITCHCTLYHVFTIQIQVSLRHHLSPLYPFLLTPHPFPSGNNHTVVCAREVFIVLLDPFTFFASPTPFSLTTVCLFPVSMSPCMLLVSLFCSLDFNISEILGGPLKGQSTDLHTQKHSL